MRCQRRAAFFDVDNTIIRVKTMFSFSEYFLCSNGRGQFSSYQEFIAHLNAYPERDQRDKLNREFYRNFKGVSKSEVEVTARSWFEEISESYGLDLWNFPVLKMIDILRHQQYLIVAVSGSFQEALSPLADHLSLDECLATKLKTCGGVYTGEIEASLIGEGKALAIREFARAKNVNLFDSIGVGDHRSDLPMLELVGEPYVVGGDQPLEKIASQRGWPLIDVGQPVADGQIIHV